MTRKTPKPRFRHRPVQGMPERVESYCMHCREFVAASDKPRALKIAEAAHVCAKLKPKK